MTDLPLPAGLPYAVFRPRGLPEGGKVVRVFPDAAGDLAARARVAEPLSVFTSVPAPAELHLRVFTPQREKGESDSATVAALTALAAAGRVGDLTEVVTPQGRTPAQLCGGEWLLMQGQVEVTALSAPGGPEWPPLPAVVAAHIASTGRPNLMLQLGTLDELDSFVPDAAPLSELGHQTQTTGLVLYALAAPSEGPQRRADVSFRAFGPLKGFLEDAASSNMFACLTGVLLERGLTPTDTNLLRGAQRQPGAPALLTAQFGEPGESIWVGGSAEPLEGRGPETGEGGAG